MNDAVVFHNGEQVSVPKEAAKFLEANRKRVQAQVRQDKRQLSRAVSKLLYGMLLDRMSLSARNSWYEFEVIDADE